MSGNNLICVLGVYGKGNLGDEALLMAITNEISNVIPDAKFVVFCSDPDVVKAQHKMQAVSRSPSRSLFSKIRILKKARILVLGGGTMLYDQDSWKEDLLALGAFLLWPLTAKLLRVPVMAYAQGLGPANHKLIQFAIRKIFNSLDGITLRDRRSFELLKKTVNKSVHARISCDAVIGSRLFSPGNVKSLLSAKEPLNNNVNEYLKAPYIILSVRHSDVNHEKATSFYHNLSVCLTKFYRSASFRFLLLPIQKSTKYADDRPVLKKLSDMLAEENVDTEVVQDLDNIFDAIALLQNAELVISNRLHALLLAASAGVPIYAISHQDKIQGCLEMLDSHDSCEIVQLNELSSEGCFPALTRLIKSTEESRKKLAGSVRTWSVNSIVNREVLTNLI